MVTIETLKKLWDRALNKDGHPIPVSTVKIVTPYRTDTWEQTGPSQIVEVERHND